MKRVMWFGSEGCPGPAHRRRLPVFSLVRIQNTFLQLEGLTALVSGSRTMSYLLWFPHCYDVMMFITLCEASKCQLAF